MVCTAPRHRLGRMLISEAFLLLVTTEDGKWLASSPAVPIALAGGLLAELAANGRAAVDDRGRLAPPADPSPLGDPILDQALETFLQNVGKKPKDVLGTVAKGLGDELYERLATAGIVEIHRGRFLRPNRFPVRNPDARARVWDDVAAVLGGTAAPDLRTGTLLGLTQAASVLAVHVEAEGTAIDLRGPHLHQLHQRRLQAAALDIGLDATDGGIGAG